MSRRNPNPKYDFTVLGVEYQLRLWKDNIFEVRRKGEKGWRSCSGSESVGHALRFSFDDAITGIRIEGPFFIRRMGYQVRDYHRALADIHVYDTEGVEAWDRRMRNSDPNLN